MKGLQLPMKAFQVKGIVYEGDTIPYIELNPIKCYGEKKFKTARERARWNRLRYDVKVVYPYAILAAAMLKEYDNILAAMPEEKRNAYTKAAEKELKKRFGAELKALDIDQGRILMKLL